MRRVWIALALSIAFVAPGVARRAEQDRHPPAERARERARARAAISRQPAGGPRTGRWPGLGAPGACAGSFGTDISDLLLNAPGNGWVVVASDCAATPGCDDYFVLSCLPGDLVEATFCAQGGGAGFDSDLSVWTAGSLEVCAEDTCGQQSAIAYTTSGAAFQRYRVGAASAGGSYSLAVNVPASCAVGGPIGVTLQGASVE